jgi:hypothetical protein
VIAVATSVNAKTNSVICRAVKPASGKRNRQHVKPNKGILMPMKETNKNLYEYRCRNGKRESLAYNCIKLDWG